MKKTVKTHKNITKGVGVLVISGLIAKILAALYRFPYQNIVGDAGFYAYQQVYPFYSIITTLSLTALPNFLSSLINSSDDTERDIQQFFQVTLIFCLGLFAGLTIFAYPLAGLIGDYKLAPALFFSATPLLLAPLLSLFRGEAQSRLEMKTTAISQVIEQSTRVGFIIATALLFLVLPINVFQTATLAMAGSFLAACITFYYLLKRKVFSFRKLFLRFTDWRPKLAILKKFGGASLVFTFFMIYMLLFQLVDVFVVKNALVVAGASSEEAMIVKGIYDRGQPFLQLGMVFVTSIFTDSLPELTKHHDKKAMNKLFNLAFYLSTTLTVGLITLLPLMNKTLFIDNDYALALIIFSAQIAPLGLIQFYHHSLFLEGHNKKSGLILLIGLIVKIIITPQMTLSYDLLGASMSSLVSLSLVLVLYMIVSKRFIWQIFNFKYWISISAMLVIIYGLESRFSWTGRLKLLFEVIILALLGGLTFILVARKLKALPDEVWEILPFFKKEKSQ